MIQRRELSENIGTINYMVSGSGAMNVKVTIKEKKAAKRKEKSRVAAQIRRNKESQTLILLQNALPLALPSPSQMLEKSIVIRIAGQTLFLMNTLDQVLGMNGWLTIPLISNNFLTFFMDVTGQIVYASPNIQFLLEQYHWSNLIGMSIYDVVDFKSRWPINGEVVCLRLPTISTMSNNPEPFHSWPLSNPQPNCSRAAVASKLNIRMNSQTWNNSSSTCSLYNVWCCTNANHTNSKLKLLILQAVRIKSSILNDISTHQVTLKPLLLSKSNSKSLQRSISWPSLSNPIKIEDRNPVQGQLDDDDLSTDNYKCIYQQMITSAHDRYFNFKSASIEFCELIGESPRSLADLNLLDIIHLEDVIEIKSFLDNFVDNSVTRAWTPVYRIMGQNGLYSVVKTLAKQYSMSSSYSLVLNHLMIETAQVFQHLNADTKKEQKFVSNHQNKLISNKSGIEVISNAPPNEELHIIRAEHENVILKRKFDDKRRVVCREKYVKIVNRTVSVPSVQNIRCFDSNHSVISSPKVHLLPGPYDSNLTNEMLCNDPFLPIGFERSLPINRASTNGILNSFDDSKTKISKTNKSKDELRIQGNCNYPYARSPSYSLESCVMTSPGSESTDIPIEDQFVWELCDSFQEINQLNYWLGGQFQTELELSLPI